MTPELRFPEFSGEWQVKKLGDVARIYDGTHQTPKYVDKGIPFYSVEQVTADDFKNTKFVANEVYNAEKVKLEKGDILMTRIGDIGTAKYLDWDVRASYYVSLSLIKPNDEVDGKYIEKYISTNEFQSELWRRTIHVAFPKKINLGEIGDCVVRIPQKSEQEKIAEFLTAVDARIAAGEQKLASLAQYKKAVMQQIFSQQIRFKDENDNPYPEWEERRLGEVLKPGSKIPVEDTSKYQKITVSLNKGGVKKAVLSRKMTDTRPFYIRDEGEIIIGKQNYFNGSIAIIPRTLSGTICSNAIMSFKTHIGISTKFLYELISGGDFLKKRSALANGTGQKELSEKEFLNFNMVLPTTEEQQKIATFLTALDARITAETTRLASAKEWKKGLLQRMFV